MVMSRLVFTLSTRLWFPGAELTKKLHASCHRCEAMVGVTCCCPSTCTTTHLSSSRPERRARDMKRNLTQRKKY